MQEQRTPYDAPKSDLVNPEKQKLALTPVSNWLRLANFIIDYLGYLGLSLAIGILIGLLNYVFNEGDTLWIEEMPDLVFGLLTYLLYYIPMEALWGRSLGKLITGTRVVNDEGLKPSFGQIIGRTFSRLVPFEPFSFFADPGRGWHDSGLVHTL